MATYSYNQGAVQTAFEQYIAYDLSLLTIPLQLNWPIAYQDSPNVVASLMNITNSVAAGTSTLQLPDATQVSVGTTFQVMNSSAYRANVIDFDGDMVGTIDFLPGVVLTFWLVSNVTSAGTWLVFDNATAATSDAQAGQLAGEGLISYLGSVKLNTELAVQNIGDSQAIYNITVGDRANLFIWTGTGSAVFNLPDPNTTGVGNGFYFAVNNQGGGTVSLTSTGGLPLPQIDGAPSPKEIDIGQTLFLATDDANWFSVGLGEQVIQTLQQDEVNITVPVTAGVRVLTNAEANLNLLTFIGTLTEDILVEFPAVSGDIWYIFNNTTGAYVVSMVRAGDPPGDAIIIPPDERLTIGMDNTGLWNTPTILTPGTSILFQNGSQSDPSIKFLNDQSTGIYLAQATNLPGTPGILGLTVSGNEVLQLKGNGVAAQGQGIFNVGTILIPSITFPFDGGFFQPAGPVVGMTDGTNSILGMGPRGLTLNIANSSAALPCLNFSSFNPAIGYTNPPTGAGIYGTGTTPTTATVNIAINSIDRAVFSTAGLVLSTPLAIASGGTNAANAPAAFNNLSPITTLGDTIYGSAPNTSSRLAVAAKPGAGFITRTQGGGFIPAWAGLSILQILQTVVTDVFTVTGNTFTPVTPLTISITPTSTNSKIFFILQSGFSFSASSVILQLDLMLSIGGGAATPIYQGTAGSSANASALVAAPPTSVGNIPQNFSIVYLDQGPVTQVNRTYSINAATSSGSAFLNRTTDSTGGIPSSITVVEIGGF